MRWSEPGPQRDDVGWRINAPWRESLRCTHRTPAVSSGCSGSPAHQHTLRWLPPPTLTASLNHLPHTLLCSESAMGQTQPGTDGDSLALSRHSVTVVLRAPFHVCRTGRGGEQSAPSRSPCGQRPGGGAGAGGGAPGRLRRPSRRGRVNLRTALGTAVVKLLSYVPGSASISHPNILSRVLQLRVPRSTY